jgi:hypothetical protein
LSELQPVYCTSAITRNASLLTLGD